MAHPSLSLGPFSPPRAARASLVGATRLALAATPLLLAACGGGGAGEAGVPSLQLQGTAAVGQAFAQAVVRARCQDGQGQATTGPDGRYSLRLPGARTPCLLEVDADPAGRRRLHALVAGTTAQQAANLTPLTELQAARVLRRLPAEVFAGFDGRSGEAAAVTPAALRAAQADVSSALAGVVDATTVGDFVGAPLQAATPQNPNGGDAHDRLLDLLASRLDATGFEALQQSLAEGRRPPDAGTSYVPYLNIPGPATQEVELGGVLQFVADMNYPPNVMYIRQPVSWSLLPPALGRIDAISGRYQAPEQPGSVQVRAVRDDEPQLQASVTVVVRPWATLDRGAHSARTEAGAVVVRDATAWAALWAAHAPQRPLPAVDFTQATVLAVFAGSQGDGCAGIGFTAMQVEGDGLVAEYRRNDPPPAGVVCTMAITTPAHLVRVPRLAGAVRFIDRSGS